MTALYNEIEPFCCEWIGNLMDADEITEGAIDGRSIAELTAADLAEFERVHLFAGCAGWELALRLAGWPAGVPVWTGSCPCQPFSAAGKRKGEADERHLWPEMFRLIGECRPAIVLGEQVASKDGLRWLDGVFADLEGAGYACGAADLCAAGVGAPHIRQRLYWVAVANGERSRPGSQTSEAARQWNSVVADDRAGANRLEHANSPRHEEAWQSGQPGWRGRVPSVGCGPSGLDHSERPRPQERIGIGAGHRGEDEPGPWEVFELASCADGKHRRIPTQRRFQPLAHGIPRNMGSGEPTLRHMVRRARRNRVGRIKAYGNAIVPQVAARFIRCVMEGTA